MSSVEYKDFEWHVPEAGNGESGAGLTRKFVAIVAELQGVQCVCDLGCGNGYMAGQLAELGLEVTGIDASQSGIEIARANFPGAMFLQMTLEAVMSGSGPRGFDLVVSSDVIEHLYRPSDLIEAASSLLKPNGRLLIGTPYHGYLKNLALSLTGKMEAHYSALHDGGHIKFFSVASLSRLLQSHGFNRLEFKFYGRAPRLWKNMICHAQKSN